MKIDVQKGAEHVGNAIGKAAEVGKKAANGAIAGVQILANRAQEESIKAQLKKYNPVFPDQYTAPDFGLSNLIMIVDDVVRKDIDVCKGAIGWKTFEKGVEVFHLYDEAIAFSGLHFIPAAVCDSVYYVDAHDRSRFIRLDCYFEKMQEAKLAELQHIAFSLGAKKYSVEMYDTTRETRSTRQTGALTEKKAAGKVSASAEQTLDSEKRKKSQSLASAEFSGEVEPTQPTLCWFAHDDNINNLIHMRCAGAGKSAVKTYSIELEGEASASMGVSTAAKLDAAVGSLGIGHSMNLQSKAVEERHHKMSFYLEF